MGSSEAIAIAHNSNCCLLALGSTGPAQTRGFGMSPVYPQVLMMCNYNIPQ